MRRRQAAVILDAVGVHHDRQPAVPRLVVSWGSYPHVGY